jgi:hypothetical protein
MALNQATNDGLVGLRSRAGEERQEFIAVTNDPDNAPAWNTFCRQDDRMEVWGNGPEGQYPGYTGLVSVFPTDRKFEEYFAQNICADEADRPVGAGIFVPEHARRKRNTKEQLLASQHTKLKRVAGRDHAPDHRNRRV